jgi:hypothetical protein
MSLAMQLIYQNMIVDRAHINAIPLIERLQMEDHGREPRRTPDFDADPVVADTGAFLFNGKSIPSKEVDGSDIENEEYRVYIFFDENGKKIEHVIDNPLRLKVGNTTHRVLDSKFMVHCVPNVGHRGCVLKWKPRDIRSWCDF